MKRHVCSFLLCWRCLFVHARFCCCCWCKSHRGRYESVEGSSRQVSVEIIHSRCSMLEHTNWCKVECTRHFLHKLHVHFDGAKINMQFGSVECIAASAAPHEMGATATPAHLPFNSFGDAILHSKLHMTTTTQSIDQHNQLSNVIHPPSFLLSSCPLLSFSCLYLSLSLNNRTEQQKNKNKNKTIQ